MIYSVQKDIILTRMFRVLRNFFELSSSEEREITLIFSEVLKRISFNFKHVKSSYYKQQGLAYFDHFNADHMTVLYYEFSRACYKNGLESLATKFFYINKIMHSIDIFYTVEMPNIYLFVHPMGSIIGSGTSFGDRVVIYQGVTLGSNSEGNYPVLKGNNILFSGASCIGSCQLSDGVVLGANAYCVDESIESFRTVLNGPANRKKRIQDTPLISQYFYD